LEIIALDAAVHELTKERSSFIIQACLVH
jgi:hypothetical protein